MMRLRQVDCSIGGITRRRCGRGFAYHDATGRRVDDATVSRIRELAIPPAWDEVWICPWANGHLQATGVDNKGRRQYLYHQAWRDLRDREKFDRMLRFAAALPRLRGVVATDLAARDLSHPQILACAARLLDIGFFRIGTETYAETNETYGLATMLKGHVTVAGGTVTFDYPAKDSKRRVQSVVDPIVAEVVMQLKRRSGGGPELLAYRSDVHGRVRWMDVTSEDINAYLRAGMNMDCSAKDFRTWNATVLAAVAFAVGSLPPGVAGRKRRVTQVLGEVAHYLGNTAAVARRSYVDTRVIDLYLAGETISVPARRHGQKPGGDRLCIQGPIERAVLDLLDGREQRLAPAA